MKHLDLLSRGGKHPAHADGIEELSKIIGEALTLAGTLLAVLTSWQNLEDAKQ